MPSTDIKDYYRRAWGIGDRVGFGDGTEIVEGIELIEKLKFKKDKLGRPFISDYQEKLKILKDLQKNKYINPNTNKAFTPKEWLDASPSYRSKHRDVTTFLEKKKEYQKKHMAEKKKDVSYKKKFLESKKEEYYTTERKKWKPTVKQSGRGVLLEQRNKMLSYMSNAAQKGNTNYTEIIKNGKFLGVTDNATGINYYEAGYKGKLGSKSKLITAHADFKNVNSLAKLAEKFKRALPNKAIQSYFSTYGKVPTMGQLYNYLQADPRYLSKMKTTALTNNPLQLHHQISMAESPTKKFQLLLKDRNNQAGVLMEEYKKGNITRDKLNSELKKINARVRADKRYIGAKDIVPEQQVKVAKRQTTQLFNKMLKENPEQLKKIAKLITKQTAKRASAKLLYPAMIANELLFGRTFDEVAGFPLTVSRDVEQIKELGDLAKEKFNYFDGGIANLKR
jgi:hypothetical protein